MICQSKTSRRGRKYTVTTSERVQLPGFILYKFFCSVNLCRHWIRMNVQQLLAVLYVVLFCLLARIRPKNKAESRIHADVNDAHAGVKGLCMLVPSSHL